MHAMFYVRSAHALGPRGIHSRSPPYARRLRRRRPTPPARLPARTSSFASHALFSTRQYASAFNHPLSFDTSSVTNMRHMFHVRSVRALAHSLQSGPPSARR